MKSRLIDILLFLLFLALVITRLSAVMYQISAAGQLSEVRVEADGFRRQQLSEYFLPYLYSLEQESSMTPGELLTVLGLGTAGSISRTTGSISAAECVRWKSVMVKYNPVGYETVSRAYSAIWDDVICFPVAAGGITYENTWMFERTYGGLRGHEGCDLMPPENISGHYRIVSMTEGIVENIGWLPKGGYRIGIRSPSGGYFYYAHLDSYSDDFQVGDAVTAGTVLGLMGDTGYGEEGTRGKFDVHLHLGIYIRTDSFPELSVNPYWVLRYLQYRLEADGTSAY